MWFRFQFNLTELQFTSCNWMKLNEWRRKANHPVYTRVSFIPCFISFGEMKKRNWIQHSHSRSASFLLQFHSQFALVSANEWEMKRMNASLRVAFLISSIHASLPCLLAELKRRTAMGGIHTAFTRLQLLHLVHSFTLSSLITVNTVAVAPFR